MAPKKRTDTPAASTTTIVVLSALDTKGEEARFLKEQLEQRGHRTLVVDLGILDPPFFEPDISRDEVARAADADLRTLVEKRDRGKAVAAMTRGVEKLIPRLHARGQLNGLIAMGGSAGTTMATAAMRTLPLGVPKVMISTVAGGDVRSFLGVKDILMYPAIVDISGLNRISRQVIAQAAGAVSGMVQTEVPEDRDKPLIAASMFGNTTPCVEKARSRLEERGYEVLVFHATGTGGKTMENLIEEGYIGGVLDITTTEWADEFVGGVMSAGPDRLTAAARAGVPAVVAPGCLDMVNFWAPETIPEKFQDRIFYQHNPNVTLMRTTAEENTELGKILADKLNASKGPCAVYLPLKGISMISAPGEPFYLPEADRALFDAIKKNLHPRIPVHEMDANINDPEFALAVTDGLLELMSGMEAKEKEGA